MRIVTFEHRNQTRLGVLTADGQAVEPMNVPQHHAVHGVLSLLDHDPSALAAIRRRPPLPLHAVSLLAPIPQPRRNIFCIGKNYFEHVREFANSGYDSSAVTDAPPDAPIVFSKLPECVIAHGAPIRYDDKHPVELDYEAELAVIIGRPGHGIAAEQALAHVWGYTIVNDVTARDLQKVHKQWLLGKAQDTFCPMGPCAVTRDEIDLASTRIQCWVNDEPRQDSTTNMMIFDVPTLVATISRGITLQAGDIIATGTPAGVGIGFKPPRFLTHGDRIRIEIGGIGVLENRVLKMNSERGSAARSVMQ